MATAAGSWQQRMNLAKPCQTGLMPIAASAARMHKQAAALRAA